MMKAIWFKFTTHVGIFCVDIMDVKKRVKKEKILDSFTQN